MILDLPEYKYKAYITNGKYHRADGPAIIEGDSTWYYQNGVLHREDGPAVSTANSREWWLYGKPHRVDGPARMFRDSMKAEFWIEGNYVEHADFSQPNADKTVFESHWSK